MSDQETGVESTESTASSESPPAPETQSAATGQEAQPSAEKPAPFHEHPRFKELIEQNREYKSSLEGYSKQVQELQAKFATAQNAQQQAQQPKAPSYDQVLDRLKQIDPEFGTFQAALTKEMQELPEIKSQLQAFQQWQQQQQLESTRTQAEGILNKLYDSNKVPDKYRPFYRAQIENMAYNNPNSSLRDVEGFFKSTHESVSKFMEDFKREERESYVKAKTKDVTPATQSGGQAASAAKNAYKTESDRIAAISKALREGRSQA